MPRCKTYGNLFFLLLCCTDGLSKSQVVPEEAGRDDELCLYASFNSYIELMRKTCAYGPTKGLRKVVQLVERRRFMIVSKKEHELRVHCKGRTDPIVKAPANVHVLTLPPSCSAETDAVEIPRRTLIEVFIDYRITAFFRLGFSLLLKFICYRGLLQLEIPTFDSSMPRH